MLAGTARRIPGQAGFTLEEGEDLRIECRGQELHLTSEQPQAVVSIPRVGTSKSSAG